MATKTTETGPADAGDLPPAAGDNMEQLQDMEVEVSIEMGRAKLTLDEALALGEQSLLELNKNHGEAVDIRLNGKLFGRGEVVVVGENFGVRLTEIVGQSEGGEA